MQTKPIIGRYGPSPTGDLHLGNLRTALLAWLQSRLQGGQFLMRMEDLDTPREIAGSAYQILADLAWLGLDWDGEVVYQSKRQQHYRQAIQQLTEKGLVYPCFCSRKDIRNAVSAPHGTVPVYPRTCANLTVTEIKQKSQSKAPALRLRVDDCEVQFVDRVLGEHHQKLLTECGDFVIKRSDGLFAYQLAVVVDDAEQGVTDVVRGEDLLDSTAKQLHLFDALGQQRPDFWHMPMMFDHNNVAMAKRHRSQSAQQWRAQCNNPQQLVAHLANSVGLIEQTDSISAQELLAELDYQRFIKLLV